jgi:multisubunit Na+/H+ antiporter MnhF subunit
MMEEERCQIKVMEGPHIQVKVLNMDSVMIQVILGLVGLGIRGRGKMRREIR